MRDTKVHTRLSFAMTLNIVFLTGLAFYAGAPALILPGVAIIFAIWSAWFLLGSQNNKAPLVRALVILFFGYTIWFAGLTGGIYSPGVLLIFSIFLTGTIHSDRPWFIFYVCLVLSGLVFFNFISSPGPAAFNINEHRFLFFLIMVFTFGSFSFITISQEREYRIGIETAKQTLDRVSGDAKNALEVKDRFLANMSHEIRNPMNGIIGMIHVLLDSELDDQQRKHANIVQSSARALLSIVNDILDLSKIEAGKLELDIRSFDLEIAIADIVSLPELQARQKGIEFSYSIDSDVPRRLKGDIGRIRQVILNLTGNAVKFTESGSVALEISLENDDLDPAMLKFNIEDTGIGIKSEGVEKLFSPFVQADASITREYGGTGLGLSISKFLIEKMGGRIGAESIEMVGSTFWFELPLEKQAPAEPVINLSALPTSEIRVLVIGDDLTLGRNITTALNRDMVQYDHAEDETKALDILVRALENATPFHVILMDVTESDQYARSMGKKLNEHADLSRINRILVTAVGQKGDALDFEKLGFSAYLSHPLESGMLRDCIRAVSAVSGKQTASDHPIITRFTLVENKKQGCKILIVDDMETNRITARVLINKQGYLTDEANNGAHAVEKIKTTSYDLILMDCQMPVMDGYKACRIIREHETSLNLEKTPIIAMTGNAFEKDREKCFQAGMDDFIAKPVEPDLLARMLSIHLNKGDQNPESDLIQPILPDETQDDGTIVPVFDRETLAERFGNDQELIQMILESFFQELPVLIESLSMALDKKDSDAVRLVAHSIKGSAANVNAEQLRQTAFGLELMAKEGNLESADLSLTLIRTRFSNFSEETGQ